MDLLRQFLMEGTALTLPVFEGEGGGGGGGGAPGGGEGGDWSPPEGLPGEFAGKSADETLANLMGGYSKLNERVEGLRGELSKMPKAPESPDGYDFKPSEKLAPFFAGGDNDNKVMAAARTAAHGAGISAEQFSTFLEGTFGPLAEGGLLASPFDAKAELATYAKAAGLEGEAAQQALSGHEAFAKGLYAQLQGIPDDLKEQAQAELMALTDTAGGNLVLKALQARLGDAGIRVEGEGVTNTGDLTKEELTKLDTDPRIDPANRDHEDATKRFDPDLRKKYDEAYQKLYPGKV